MTSKASSTRSDGGRTQNVSSMTKNICKKGREVRFTFIVVSGPKIPPKVRRRWQSFFQGSANLGRDEHGNEYGMRCAGCGHV